MANQALEGKKFTRPNNLAMFQDIHKNASPLFQSRVPYPTKAKLQKSTDEMLKVRGFRNEFVWQLVNRFGMDIIDGADFVNPLRKFNGGFLSNGAAAVETYVDLIKATVFNHERDALEKDVWGKELPNVGQIVHTINREDVYKITIQAVSLRRAFDTEFGLSDFTMQLMATLATSNEVDEFEITANLFAENHRAGGFFKVNVADVGDMDSGAAEAKRLLRLIREFSENLRFVSPYYTPSGMNASIRPEDLELFVTPEVNAALDVEALAAAFNIERAAVPSRITVIPKRSFGIPGVQAVLTSRKFFKIWDTLRETTDIANPAGLYENYWLHVHQIISFSPFVPGILFWTGEGDEIKDVVTPVESIEPLTLYNDEDELVTSATRGYSYQVLGLAVTDPEGGYNDAVKLSLDGSQSLYTRVLQNGTLQVGIDEASTSLTITATATDNNDITATLVVPVVGRRVHLWPNPEVIEDDDNDGLGEVTPTEPVVVDNVATIPKVTGVQYRIAGQNVNAGSHHAIPEGGLTVTAVARANYELATGAPSSFTLTHTAAS